MNIFTKVPGFAQQTRYVVTTLRSRTPHQAASPKEHQEAAEHLLEKTLSVTVTGSDE